MIPSFHFSTIPIAERSGAKFNSKLDDEAHKRPDYAL
jgi:hypothetical protein